MHGICFFFTHEFENPAKNSTTRAALCQHEPETTFSRASVNGRLLNFFDDVSVRVCREHKRKCELPISQAMVIVT